MIKAFLLKDKNVEASEVYRVILRYGMCPDDYTFPRNCASAHLGCGLNLLNIMCNVYNIEPKSENHGCIVDILCRSGHVEKAYKMVQRVPVSGSATEEAIAWRASLSACCSHRHVDLAKAAAERVVKLERHSGAYVLLSMRTQVEINCIVHEFVAGEGTHPKMDGIYNILEVIKGEFNLLQRNIFEGRFLQIYN
ncbi:putative pentatricopeptide repeat-containing protein At5g59200, chloroplastic [Primulina eburnea]|uniref:putative pentatricopeptide repeat-containing protein At5g59200, chloroplastic n=1 Tax=Primulina eburnea TaxID=1245227 RepID=UPI003C6C76E0